MYMIARSHVAKDNQPKRAVLQNLSHVCRSYVDRHKGEITKNAVVISRRKSGRFYFPRLLLERIYLQEAVFDYSHLPWKFKHLAYLIEEIIEAERCANTEIDGL